MLSELNVLLPHPVFFIVYQTIVYQQTKGIYIGIGYFLGYPKKLQQTNTVIFHFKQVIAIAIILSKARWSSIHIEQYIFTVLYCINITLDISHCMCNIVNVI